MNRFLTAERMIPLNKQYNQSDGLLLFSKNLSDF